MSYHYRQEENSRLAAENERLRDALEDIAHGVVGIADASMREKILMDIAEKNLKG